MRARRFFISLFVLIILTVNVNADIYEDQDVLPNSEGSDSLEEVVSYLLRNRENRREAEDVFENWHGRWMPDRPGDPTPPPKIFGKTSNNNNQEVLHGIPMGQPSAKCDDAKTNLTIDWDYSAVNYTCYDRRITPDRTRTPQLYCEMIPKQYVAMHKCMYEKIEYDEHVPLFGTHRPLWPVYGEYKFLPKQRWLHSLEHGAIVMLYHPCANPLEVKRLKSLVKGCLRRHIISPYNLVDENQPLVLLSWGCKLTMSYVNPVIVTKFIAEYALKGPEDIARDGDFTENLIDPAETISDMADSLLCREIRS